LTNEEALTSQSSKRRILVVDNEKDITIALQVELEDVGFDVDTFTDPSLALKSFKPNFYDLVLIDIIMPNMDGFELHERLKKIDPDMKVCFLTASEMYHEEFRKVEHCILNEDIFLQKPISTDDLVKEVNKKIDKKIDSSNRYIQFFWIHNLYSFLFMMIVFSQVHFPSYF
jgi:DNA-binding NtrC family response regulator